jgi:hypothetical protein
MVSRFAVLAGAVLLALTMAGACAPNASNAIKPAMDAPTHFLVRAADGKAVEATPGEACHNPMIDPRDGAFLILVRSAGGHGDYQVPVARYGVRKGELLRIECGTGLVVGIVKR